MDRQALEKIAESVVAEANLRPPFDPYRLVFAADLDVKCAPGITPAVLDGNVWVRSEDPPERQRATALHELAHELLKDRGCDSEAGADYLGAALANPRRFFLGCLVRRGWDLRALREECPWTSYEALARRIVDTRLAVAWVCDRGPELGRRSRRYRSIGVGPKYEKPLTREREMVAQAARTLEPAIDGARIGAWPVPSARVLRVVSVLSPELLAA